MAILEFIFELAAKREHLPKALLVTWSFVAEALITRRSVAFCNAFWNFTATIIKTEYTK